MVTLPKLNLAPLAGRLAKGDGREGRTRSSIISDSDENLATVARFVAFAQRMVISEQARNRLAILKAIRHGGPVARTQLPGLTGLSAGTVSAVTADLVARGLVLEQRDSAPTRGRPRAYLSINSGGAVVVGAVIDGLGKLAVSFVDLSGRLLHSSHAPLVPAGTIAAMADAIAKALHDAIAASPFSPTGLDRIGLALPAIVDARTGTVLFMTTLPRDPMPFAATLAAALGIPVTIENDLAVMARAEHWFGRAQAMDTFTLVNFGFALGSARYVDGLPWTGASGISPDIGHTKIAWGPDARSCYCGGRGCATAYSSMFGLLTAAGRLDNLVFPPVKLLGARFSDLLDEAGDGNPQALAILREGGARLGQALANHINSADPGNIVVLLPDGRLHALIADAFEDALVAAVMPGMLETVRLHFEVEDNNWHWQGTAALALEQTFLAGNLKNAFPAR